MPDNDMGKGELAKGGGSLVESDFVKLSEAWNMPLKETKQHVMDLLKKELESDNNTVTK